MSGLNPEQERQLQKSIESRNLIAAIKLYREITGVGLKEAKDAVEAMMYNKSVSIPASVWSDKPDIFLVNQIKRLLAEQKKIEAIKIYRETYNCGLKDAKDAVDAIERQMRLEGSTSMASISSISNNPFAADTARSRGCMAISLALVFIVLAGLAFFFLNNGF